MNYQDDLYDWVMEHNPELLDSSFWSEEEREAQCARQRQFRENIDKPAPEPNCQGSLSFVIRYDPKTGQRSFE